jgi:hypothetical protein
MSTATFEAIGVLNQVTVADAAALPDALAIAEREVGALDDACSRFRDDSELAQVNRAQGRPVEVSPLLLDAAEAALRAAALTSGAVDPTVGGSLAGLGWNRDFARILVEPGASPPFRVVPPGWRSIELDRERRRIRVPAGTPSISARRRNRSRQTASRGASPRTAASNRSYVSAATWPSWALPRAAGRSSSPRTIAPGQADSSYRSGAAASRPRARPFAAGGPAGATCIT